MEAFNISIKRFDEFAAEYANKYNSIDSYLSSINKFCDLIKSDTPKILELACGPGNISKYDANKLISNCSKLLNKYGVVYISTMEGDESEAGFESTNFSGDYKIYFNYHQQKDIENAFVENGFNINEIKRQDYIESDGRVLIDMIFIATKNN